MRRRVQLNILIGLASDPSAHAILDKLKAYAKTYRMSLNEYLLRAGLGKLTNPPKTPARPIMTPSPLTSPTQPFIAPKPPPPPPQRYDEDGIEMDLNPSPKSTQHNFPTGRPS